MKHQFVIYQSNKFITNNAILTSEQPNSVTIEGDHWWYEKGTKSQQGPFEIGYEPRIPNVGENKEFFGPMMVIEKGNRKHYLQMEIETRKLWQGILV